MKNIHIIDSIQGYKQEAQRATYCAPEYNVPLFWGIGQGQFLITDRTEKLKLGRGRWDIASCRVSFNSIQLFQRRSQKCLSQSEARAAILFFRLARNTQTWLRTLRSCFLLSFVEFQSAVSEEKSKMSQPIKVQGGHLVFPISPKNTNLVEDVEFLLPVKFRWILFSGFRGEVENVSANQRPGPPSCFSDQPEKHKLSRGCWVLASCQVSLNFVQWFRRRSQKCEKLTTDGRTASAQVH